MPVKRRSAHRLIWGDAAPLEAIRWREPEHLPAVEAVRYLFNRGAALLWARRMLETSVGGRPRPAGNSSGLPSRRPGSPGAMRMLLWHGRYTTRYGERMDRLAGILASARTGLRGRTRIAEALRFKLQPDFEAGQPMCHCPICWRRPIAGHESSLALDRNDPSARRRGRPGRILAPALRR